MSWTPTFNAQGGRWISLNREHALNHDCASQPLLESEPYGIWSQHWMEMALCLHHTLLNFSLSTK